MQKRWLVTWVLALLLSGCNDQEMSPPTQLDRIRVLAVRIDGPPDPARSDEPFAELKPGDTATLTPLVLAPGMAPKLGDGMDMTVPQTVCLEDYRRPSWDRSATACPSDRVPIYRFWAWCPPLSHTNPCLSAEVLGSPARIFGTEGIQPLGDTCPPPSGSDLKPVQTACVQPPADLFANLPPDDLTRRRGLSMSVLLLAVIDMDGDYAAGRLSRLIDKVRVNAIPWELAWTEVPVLDQPSNHNPTPADILQNATAMPDVLDREGQLTVKYLDYPPHDPRESYAEVKSDGTEKQQTEQLVVAWFSGFGRFGAQYTVFDAATVFTPATGNGIDLPPPGPPESSYSMPLVAVIRDRRGGQGWVVRSVIVARQ